MSRTKILRVLTESDINARFQKQLVKLLDDVEVLRGLDIDHPVPHQIEAVEQMISDLKGIADDLKKKRAR